ncbi:hypothetical protein R6Q57_005532 [Mikania cordata]
MEGPAGNLIVKHQQTHPYCNDLVNLFSSESFRGCPNVVTTINSDVDKQQVHNNPYTISFKNPTSPQDMNHIYGRSKLNYPNATMREDDQTSLNELHGFINDATSSRNKRNHRQLQDHVLAERKRREKLTERFIALYSLLPGLKKMDKITVLEDARKYIIQLQTSVKELEETCAKGKDMIEELGVSMSKFCGGHEDVACSSHDTNYLSSFSTFDPVIKARISGRKMLVRIYCMKSPSILLRTLSEMERLRIIVECCSVLPFDAAHLITIIAQPSGKWRQALRRKQRSAGQGRELRMGGKWEIRGKFQRLFSPLAATVSAIDKKNPSHWMNINLNGRMSEGVIRAAIAAIGVTPIDNFSCSLIRQ